LFLLQKIKFEEIRKNYSYIITYIDHYILQLYMSNFFHFLNLIFCKRNNAKIILLIIYYILLLLSFLCQIVILQKKEGYIYEHILYIIIYVYIYLYIFLYEKFFYRGMF